ncbi:MAG: PAS domain S-box protein [Burkholderiales bacterium]|nr:MAG: PAS domain S-box protein [Burkholderiales bacterium]
MIGMLGLAIDLQRLGEALPACSAPYARAAILDAQRMVLAARAESGLQLGSQLQAIIEPQTAPRFQALDDLERLWHGEPLHLAQPVRNGWQVVVLVDLRQVFPVALRNALPALALLALMAALVAMVLVRLHRRVLEPLGAAAATWGTGEEQLSAPLAVERLARGQQQLRADLSSLHERAAKSEQTLRAALDGLHCAVYMLSPAQDRIVFANRAAERQFSLTTGPLERETLLPVETIAAEDRERPRLLLQQLSGMAQGEIEYRLVDNSARPRWVREWRTKAAEPPQSDTPKGWVGMLQDISGEREILDALIKSESRFRALTELSSDWYWEQDADLRFTLLTITRGQKELNVDLQRHPGLHRWDNPLAEATTERWAAHRAQLERREAFTNFEYCLNLPGGRRLFMSVSGEPIFDSAGRFAGYRGVGRDVSHERAMLGALRESEDRLALVIQATGEGIWDYDLESGQTHFSHQFAVLLGYPGSAELHQGFRFQEALHPIDRLRVLEGYETSLKLGEDFDEVYRLRRADGSYHWYRARGLVKRSAEGKVVRLLGALADIQHAKLHELELEKLSAAVEQSPVAIWITNAAGIIEYGNKRFYLDSGFQAAEVLGQTPEIVHSEATPADLFAEQLATALQGKVWSGEVLNRRKEGETYWVALQVFPLRDPRGELTHLIGIAQDICTRKALEAREAEHREALLHHARLIAMGEMAAAIAHELNQPLAAIANYCSMFDLALAQPAPALDTIAGHLAEIDAQAHRAAGILRRIREFVRRGQSEKATTDINDLVGKALKLAQWGTPTANVRWDADLAADLPHILADGIQIEQVLLNLLRNAAEAVAAGGADGRIQVRTQHLSAKQSVLVSVLDEGCGLPDRIAVDLFTPFFTTKPEGLGIGLSISRGIVAAHGGELWAAPNQGRGTTFFLRLPITPESVT